MAIADLNRAIEQTPEMLTAIRLRGIGLRMAEHFDQSIDDFQRAIDVSHDIDDEMRAELLYQQGLTYQAAEQHEQAIETFRKATTLNSKLATAYFAISMSQGAMQQFEDSKTSLDQAIAADPESSEYLLARANLQLAEAQFLQITEAGDPAALVQKAHADFERAVEVNPDDDTAWYALAVSFASAEKVQDSLNALAQAIELDPTDARYYQARSDIRLQRQQFGSAIDDLTQAIALSPDEAELYEARAFAFGELGKKEEALKDFEKADELAKSDEPLQPTDGS